jgi:hypothetical protein
MSRLDLSYPPGSGLQMATSTSTNGVLSTDTKMYVPLFLIESLINLAGYFVIKYAIGKPLKKVLGQRRFGGLLPHLVRDRSGHHGTDAQSFLQHGVGW